MNKKNIIIASALLTGLLAAGSVMAQEERQVAGVPCPKPFNLTHSASAANVGANVFTGDFAPVHLSPPRAGLNDITTNKFFLCTFRWKFEHKCCQITRAVLIVNMQSNQSGSSATSGDAGNDAIHVVHAGGAAVQSGMVYANANFPFGTATPATTTWTLNSAVLTNMNTNNRLSFLVQDDTRVLSATLQLWGCCLTN